ncbi:hypothetical protein K458DRAFT_295282 [Lentithecium fluviatile CBS 122367]|uniref:F-box domain-containing protein n=1 Tax=Lentithecium fluviatile CBS 122367 TaxID=1168545 RepID=A0A6G1JBP3_9PLEO|nr:hypothetical protein K458DRAFT_295282 [Lentithecium fluviatile CBS 122367]
MSLPKTRKRESSPELGSPSTITQYHAKTGRPIRRTAGQTRPKAGYVDSKVIEEGDDEPIELTSEDEDNDDEPIRPRRKRKRTRTPSPSPPPLEPLIRNEEPDEHTDDEVGNFHNKKASHVPPITLQFNIPLGFHGPLMVKLDRNVLLRGTAEESAQDMQPYRNKRKAAPPAAEPRVTAVMKAKGKGFADLPPELRNKVYRHLFVHDFKVSFPPGDSDVSLGRRSLCWSAQFLSTCRLVHSEGCSVLYGENTFLFDRNKQTRGPFWEAVPKEIGYTDVRRFLKTIGPENLAYLRDVHICLEDAAPSSTPYLDHESRRYVNDEHLIDCLRILRGAKLRKVYLTFGGRRNLYRADVKILGYLEQIKADEILQKEPGFWFRHKISGYVFKELQAGMTRKKKLYTSE